jgi:hypothetical protein
MSLGRRMAAASSSAMTVHALYVGSVFEGLGEVADATDDILVSLEGEG